MVVVGRRDPAVAGVRNRRAVGTSRGRVPARTLASALALRQLECQRRRARQAWQARDVTPDEVALLPSPAGRALLDRLADHLPADDLAELSRLRAEGVDAELGAAVVTQVRLRQRARARFGADADRLLW